MTDLSPAIDKEVRSMLIKRGQKRSKQAKKDKARHAKRNAYIARNVRKRRAPKGTGACGTAPWNRLTPESEMKLFLCESVRQMLHRLECAEYERKNPNA